VVTLKLFLARKRDDVVAIPLQTSDMCDVWEGDDGFYFSEDQRSRSHRGC
jgi:hypothetical protein